MPYPTRMQLQTLLVGIVAIAVKDPPLRRNRRLVGINVAIVFRTLTSMSAPSEESLRRLDIFMSDDFAVLLGQCFPRHLFPDFRSQPDTRPEEEQN
jgi:hypothetical protein